MEKVTVYQFKCWDQIVGAYNAATVRFRLRYVFVVIHHGSSRLLDCNTAHATAAWTLQQLTEAQGSMAISA